jgi:tetratricopeptide (TPR) repeat protein
MTRKGAIALALLAIAVITAASFLPSVNNDFVNYDDTRFVLQNTFIRGLSGENLANMFTRARYEQLYIPLVWISLAVDYSIWELWAPGYHAVNLALHIANTLIVFFLIRQLTGSAPAACVAAILFGIHPLHVESVAWVTERKDVLSTFFFLLALVCYVHYAKGGRAGFYILSILIFICALLSKPMAVTLAVIIVIVDWYYSRPFSARLIVEKIPFFLLSLAAGISTLLLQRGGASEPNSLENLLLGSRNLFFYLYKTVLPIRLVVFYPPPEDVSFSEPVYLAALAGFAVAVALVAFSLKLSRRLFLGLSFFLITLLPVLQFVRAGTQVAADRFVYIPSVGLFMLAGLAFDKSLRGGKLARAVGAGLVVGVSLVFSYLTFVQCEVWRDSGSLWEHALKYHPSATAYGRLGAYHHKRGDARKASELYRKALEMDPTHLSALVNLGNIHKDEGSLEEALEFYEAALEAWPKAEEAMMNKASIHFDQGKTELAIREYEEMIGRGITGATVYLNLARAYASIDENQEAIASFEKALAGNRDLAGAYQGLGAAYYKIGRIEDAIRNYEMCIERDEENAEAHFGLGYVYSHIGLPEKARGYFEKAVALKPDHALALSHLGMIAEEEGDYRTALDYYSKVLKLLTNPEARAELERLIDNLKEKVRE